MNHCCSQRNRTGQLICPECGHTYPVVDRKTLLHQITFPQNLDLGDEDYAFCAGKDCSTGYFSESRQIPKTSLRAFQPGCDEMLCYCFDISVSTYRTALSEGTAKLIREFVIQNTKKDLCVCMTRNPSGRCCLADFKRMEHDHDH